MLAVPTEGMRMVWRSVSIAVLLAVLVSACGGGADEAGGTADTTSTVVASVEESTTVPSGTIATTTTVGAVGETTTATTSAVRSDDNTAALAMYLAAYIELDALFIEAQMDPAIQGDLAAQRVLFDDYVASLEQLDPPPEAEYFHHRCVRAFGQLADATRRVTELEETGDEAALQEAAVEYIEAFDGFGRIMAWMATQWSRLTSLVLTDRPGDPEASYLVELMATEEEAAQMVQEAFSAMSLLAYDPMGALELLTEAVSDLDDLADRLQTLNPPPSCEDWHRRHIDNTRAKVAAIEALGAAFEDGDPSMATMNEINHQVETGFAEAQVLVVERERLMADVLRRIADG